jgi:serine/threonine protein kinase
VGQALGESAHYPVRCSGRSRYIGGELVPTSIDTYLVMEFGDGGDLFNLKGQLGAGEVRDLMRQLLEALTYLHTQVYFFPKPWGQLYKYTYTTEYTNLHNLIRV